MSAAVQEQVFDPFFTTKGPGQGSGLGLSQVLGFVQQSAGEVRLQSQEGEGTMVCLLFPVVPKGQNDVETADASMSGPPPHSSDLEHGSGKT
jgi:signal transduction histidine kinase